MAAPTDTFTTYLAIGNREDLIDKIYRIDPTDTPFVSGIDTGTATAVNHEWQTQALAAAAANALGEGDDAATTATTPTVRLGNYCQISGKAPRVSNTQRAVEHAGRDDELEYQEVLKGLELKRDIEFILVGANTVKSGTDPRTTASILTWIATNDDFGATGSSPSPVDGTDARNDGTPRAFTEAQLKNVLQLCWTAGGKPDTIMLGGFNKQVMSTFTGRGTAFEDAKTKKITATVTTYESDFGDLTIVPNRFMRTRDCLVLQMDMWKLCYLPGRKMVSIPLAITGDNIRRQIICEYALEACNEKASGGVFDLTTS